MIVRHIPFRIDEAGDVDGQVGRDVDTTARSHPRQAGDEELGFQDIVRGAEAFSSSQLSQ